MLQGMFARRDPFWEDGKGVRRDRTRQRIVGSIAFVLAIGACGITTAAWLRTVFLAMGINGLG